MKSEELAQTMRNFVTFDADFPDDSQWSETGDPLIPRGHSALEAIASALRGQLIRCSFPTQVSFYGWSILVEAGARFRCILQYTEPWLLICDLVPTMADRLLNRRHEAERTRVLEALAKVLHQDPRFRAVKWYSREEFESETLGKGRVQG